MTYATYERTCLITGRYYPVVKAYGLQKNTAIYGKISLESNNKKSVVTMSGFLILDRLCDDSVCHGLIKYSTYLEADAKLAKLAYGKIVKIQHSDRNA